MSSTYATERQSEGDLQGGYGLMGNGGQVAKKVLLVDDEPDVVIGARAVLEVGGYVVSQAANGLDAWDKMIVDKPDIVILDVMMPRMDGWATLDRMRLDDRFRDIPVLMLTILGEPHNFGQGLRLGCTWYLRKPIIDYDGFRRLVAGIIEGTASPPVSEPEQ